MHILKVTFRRNLSGDEDKMAMVIPCHNVAALQKTHGVGDDEWIKIVMMDGTSYHVYESFEEVTRQMEFGG